MASETEYFNAKFAGDYLGDQWVVRGSDFDRLESYHHRLREALRECAIQIDDERPTSRCMDNIVSDAAWRLLQELDNLEEKL